MDILLLIIYAAILAACIILFVRAVKTPVSSRFIPLYIIPALSCIFSWLTASYFDSLPGFGFMPGLTYFAEAISSYAAAVVFAVVFAIAVITRIIIWILRKNKAN